MYETHFGLKERPFRPVPDSSFYYPAASHERALAALQQGLDGGEGLVLLTGEAGTGKTLLCLRLLEKIDAAIVFLTNSHLRDRSALFQATLYDLSLPHEARSEQELRLALTDFLLKTFQAGGRTLLAVDEAQNLSVDLLEEVRLLGNLEGREGKAVQVVLAGQPAIDKKLRWPGLAGLRQRLAVRARLEPLEVDEATDYLSHQLRRAGGKPEQIMSSEAMEILARRTRGLPRLLNQAAHHSLSLAHEGGSRMVDAEVVLEALAQLGWETEEIMEPTSEPAGMAEREEADPVLPMGEEDREGRRLRTGAAADEPGSLGRFMQPRRPA